MLSDNIYVALCLVLYCIFLQYYLKRKREKQDGAKVYDTFLSHRKKKKEDGSDIDDSEQLCTVIKLGLQNKNLTAFFDKDDLFQINESNLKKKVLESRSMLVVIDPKIVESTWCKAEWKWAEENCIPIFPIYNGDKYTQDTFRQSMSAILHAGFQSAFHHQAIMYHGAEPGRTLFFEQIEKNLKHLRTSRVPQSRQQGVPSNEQQSRQQGVPTTEQHSLRWDPPSIQPRNRQVTEAVICPLCLSQFSNFNELIAHSASQHYTADAIANEHSLLQSPQRDIPTNRQRNQLQSPQRDIPTNWQRNQLQSPQRDIPTNRQRNQLHSQHWDPPNIQPIHQQHSQHWDPPNIQPIHQQHSLHWDPPNIQPIHRQHSLQRDPPIIQPIHRQLSLQRDPPIIQPLHRQHSLQRDPPIIQPIHRQHSLQRDPPIIQPIHRQYSLQRNPPIIQPIHRQDSELMFPFIVVVVEEFLKLDGLIKFEDASRKNGLLIEWERNSGTTIFASHKWRSQHHPDDQGKTKFKQLVQLLRRKRLQHVKYMWLDYLCVPQEDELRKQCAIDSFAFYVRMCDYFVILVGSFGSTTLEEYNKRGWCRLERFAALSPVNDSHLKVFVHNASDDSFLEAMRIPGAVPTDPEALNPIAGNFTGDKHAEVARIARPLLALCQSMLEFPRDDVDTASAIHIKQKTEAFISGKLQQSQHQGVPTHQQHSLHWDSLNIQPRHRQYPLHWTAFPDRSPYVLVKLGAKSLEYTQIFQQFSQSCHGKKFKIISISRVQNKSLYNEYQLYRSKLVQELGQNGINEKKLFHGTSFAAVDGICTDGFDWRICGKNGTLYGQGSYFASNSEYSSNYAKADFSGQRNMFLALVLVGKSVQGVPDLKKAPHGFHTAVNNVSSPSIFVVFLIKQAYPEYLITYK